MKAEIGHRPDEGGFCLTITATTPTEWSLLAHVAPILGLDVSMLDGTAVLRPRVNAVQWQGPAT